MLIFLHLRKRPRATNANPLTSKEAYSAKDDVKALRALFKLSTPDAFTNTISGSFKTAAPEHLHGLKVILGPLFESASTLLHCVRCHQTYVQSGNSEDACVVNHNEDSDPEYIRGEYDGEDGYYETSCCEKKYTEGDSPDEPCYTDWHTTDPKEVEYSEVAEDEEDGYWDDEGSARVATCRVRGCKTIRE